MCGPPRSTASAGATCWPGAFLDAHTQGAGRGSCGAQVKVPCLRLQKLSQPAVLCRSYRALGFTGKGWPTVLTDNKARRTVLVTAMRQGPSPCLFLRLAQDMSRMLLQHLSRVCAAGLLPASVQIWPALGAWARHSSTSDHAGLTLCAGACSWTCAGRRPADDWPAV